MNKEQIDEYNVQCFQCKNHINISKNDTWFDDKGFGYSTRLSRCPECGKIIIIGYAEDNHLDVNNDPRFYR